MKKHVLLLLLFGSLFASCVSEPEAVVDREDSILDFYMPRSTESSYLYKYSGQFSGKRDSMYNVDYLGTPQPGLRSVDSLSPIHSMSIKATDRNIVTDVEVFVSDSAIIEYGSDCTTGAQKFVLLHGKLKAGNGWKAAFNYQASPEFRVSYLARVMEFFPQMEANGVIYKDVWQVNYEVTSSPGTNLNAPVEYHNKARRVIYFAKGIGKILEIAYSPDSREQWQTELHNVSRR